MQEGGQSAHWFSEHLNEEAAFLNGAMALQQSSRTDFGTTGEDYGYGGGLGQLIKKWSQAAQEWHQKREVFMCMHALHRKAEGDGAFDDDYTLAHRLTGRRTMHEIRDGKSDR